jgi:recombination protein RecA
MGDQQVGLQARLMSQALRKLAGSISRSGTCVIFINQIRMKIGVMFGSPETTTGGRALKFFSTVRIDVRRIDSIKQGTEIVGNRVRAKVVKNKVAPPFRQAEFDLMYGEGISKEGSVLDLGVEEGLIAKSGAWYTYGDERLGQGREAAKEFLREHTELRDEIELKVRDSLGLVPPRRSDQEAVDPEVEPRGTPAPVE